MGWPLRFGIALLVLGLFHPFARASTDAWVAGDSLIVNEVKVLSLLGQSRRLSEIANRLRTVSREAVAHGVSIKPLGRSGADGVVASLGAKTIFQVRSAEAKTARVTPIELANLWWSKIEAAVLLPPLSLFGHSFTGSVDMPIEVDLRGSEARRAVVQIRPGGLVTYRASLGKMIFSSHRAARVTVSITSKTGEETLSLAIIPPAARLPQQVSADVMGQPFDQDHVKSATRYAIQSGARFEPGARFDLGEFSTAPIEAGSTVTLAVPVRFSAPDASSVNGVIRVTLHNRGPQRVAETNLWYSDDPENIIEFGQVFWGRVAARQSVRALFHHCNKMPGLVTVAYSLLNRSNLPTTVCLNLGQDGPQKNPTLAGYRAGISFFDAFIAKAGIVVSVPAMSALPISLIPLNSGDTGSGLVTITNLNPDQPLELFGEAQPQGGLPGKWRPTRQPAYESNPPVHLDDYRSIIIARAFQVYEAPLAVETVSYVCGGKFGFARVGEEGIKRLDIPGTLLGDFGVHYQINATLRNPGSVAQKIEILYEASAGYSGAVFAVDGIVKPAGILQTMASFRVAQVILQPGQTTVIKIETMPLSGGFYPGTLTIRPVRGGLDAR